MYDMYEEGCKINVYKWAKHRFATTVIRETHRLFDKKKVPGTAVNKNGYADSVLGHERTLDY